MCLGSSFEGKYNEKIHIKNVCVGRPKSKIEGNLKMTLHYIAFPVKMAVFTLMKQAGC
jgi:hypothetical protein